MASNTRISAATDAIVAALVDLNAALVTHWDGNEPAQPYIVQVGVLAGAIEAARRIIAVQTAIIASENA